MTSSSPRLIVTLPGRTVEATRSEMLVAQAAGADLVEVRFDRWTSTERERADALFPAPLPVLATLRSRQEGGEGPDEPQERSTILAGLARLPVRYLDLESERDVFTGSSVSPPNGTGIIESTHFPSGALLADFSRALDRTVTAGVVRKLVFPASTETAMAVLQTLARSVPLEPRIVLTTGGSGALFRALAKRLGMPFVFASLPESAGSDRVGSVEPSQVPVDRLARFFSAPGDPPLFALLGRPVAHSLSPAIHALWLADAEPGGLYIPLEIESEKELTIALDALGGLGFRGLNVTHPWKREAARQATDRSPAVAECDGANCLVRKGTGWFADNTDYDAAKRRLEELRAVGRWDGDRLAVLGGGGAARATLAASRSLGARATVYARRIAEARAVAERYDAELGDLASPRPVGLIVHATTAGRGAADALELPLEAMVGPDALVLDWVYRPTHRDVAQRTERRRADYEGGERLLVYQAAASFARWWGEPPTPAAVDAALRGVGCTA